MPTDTEIWERACERVGLWKRGQVCKGCFFTPHESKEAVRNARWENGTAHHVDHDTPAPAIDDSDAAMKMIAWALKHQLTVCIGPRWVILHNERGSNVGEGDNFDNDSSRTTPLALANAVLAVPQETQP